MHKKRIALIFLLLALPITGIVVLGIMGNHKFNTLPYFTERGAIASLVTGVYRLGDFQLLNQDSDHFGSEYMQGQVWLAAFFGTDAPHVGAMTRQLLWPNFRYRDKEGISIVCFTLSPELDTPEVL